MKAEPLILQLKYTDVVELFAKKSNLSFDEALRFFYYSKVQQ